MQLARADEMIEISADLAAIAHCRSWHFATFSHAGIYVRFRGEPDIAAQWAATRPEAKSQRGTYTLATPPIAYLRTSLLSRLVQKLLEQAAQFERRAIAAVAHDGRRDIARAIDFPFANRRAARS